MSDKIEFYEKSSKKYKRYFILIRETVHQKSYTGYSGCFCEGVFG